jgi:hypothetical protein
MSIINSLPDRPLTTAEVESIEQAAPYSGRPALDQVWAILFVTGSKAYGLGYDEEQGGWTVIEESPADDQTGAIDIAINEWVESTYGEEYGNEQVEV